MNSFVTFIVVLLILFVIDPRSIGSVKANVKDPEYFEIDFARKLVDLVKIFDKNRYFETVIDIGSSSGSITRWFSAQIEYGHLYGIDINAKNIEKAKHYFTTQTTEYVLTDLSGNWCSVDEQIKSLKANVSLVFSNMCIMYIKERMTLVKNIRKLLAPGARAYFSFSIIPDPTYKLTDELRQRFGKYLKTPPIDQQMKTWTHLFEENGLTIEYQEIESSSKFLKGNKHLVLHWWRKMLQVYHESSISWDDLSDDIRNSLIRVTIDQNIAQNSVDWKTMNRFDNEWKDDIDFELIYTVGYIVIKAIN